MRSILRPLVFASLLASPAMLAMSSVGCIISDPEPMDTTGGSCGPGDVGSEGCPCTSGGMCNAPFMCNNNLDICVADVCPVGTETCACTPKGACDPGLVCLSGLCVDATGGATGTTGGSTSSTGGADDTTSGGSTTTGSVDETGASG